jgi:Tol biopolymer transport system component
VTLAAGTRLGPYEILAPIGAGGMGEVYRARDERLKRDVAIKVLPATFSADADRLRRFEQEAQAAGGLNHPNITAVHDLGTHEGAPYIVTELLEGETLRARLSGGAISVRKAIDYAVQIAKGLAAAHEKGIIHRDLKPENLFLTNDGRVKILDFGLAKLTQAEAQSGPQTNLPTATEPGVVMGTLGYMSPEQVKGKAADQRSDLFAFGAILYEMLSGQRAFHRESAAETMSAILREEPPDLSATNRSVQPGLERIVRHCLEKNPEERFYSARDVAFDLEALSGLSGAAASTSGAVSAGPARRPSWPVLGGAVLATALVCGLAAWFAVRRAENRPPPSFHQLTFRRGQIQSARFAPDGQTVLYSAAWDDKPMEIVAGRLESPESRPFGLVGAEVLAISKSGEMAVSLNRQNSGGFQRTGTLAQLSVAGGAPREILKEIEWADWSPDGKSLTVVRTVSGKMRLEYPPGKVLYETHGWLSHPRISPDGTSVAFIDHPVPLDDGGWIAMVDRSGGVKKLSEPFATAQGLAWAPNGEIWFTAARVGGNRSLHAATPSGSLREILRVPGNLTLQDIARDGRPLLTRETWRREIVALPPGESKERSLTWLDWSLPAAISADGKRVLFSESGEGGGAGYSVYLRGMDGSPAVRLGEGSGQDLSSDGEWALAVLHPSSDPQLVLYPTGAGEPRLLSKEGLSVFAAAFMPDGKQILFSGSEPGHRSRIYLRSLDGGKPRAVTPEGYGRTLVTPDGKWVVAAGPDRKNFLYPLAGGEPTVVPGIDPEDGVDEVSLDGRSLYVHRRAELPAKVFRLDIATGRKELWRTLMPADAAGIYSLDVIPRRGGDGYVYSFNRILSDLYLVEGVR